MITIDNKEYTLYHIPGIKVGCTKRDVTKRVKEQGYIEYEVLGIYTDIKEAGIKEREYQLQYGYGYDTNELYNERYIANGIKASKTNKKNGQYNFHSAGGKVIGRLCVENGHMEKIREKSLKVPKKSWEILKKRNLEYKTCPHCGIVTRGRGYDRWHGDKCKHK